MCVCVWGGGGGGGGVDGTGPRAIWTRYEVIGPHLNRRELKNEDLYSMVRMVKKKIHIEECHGIPRNGLLQVINIHRFQCGLCK